MDFPGEGIPAFALLLVGVLSFFHHLVNLWPHFGEAGKRIHFAG